MKNLFVFLFLCNFLLLCHAHGGGNYEHSDMLASMKPGDKAALLMVHFGTTHDDTRALTIDAINAKAQAAFPELMASMVRARVSSCVVPKCTMSRAALSPGFILASISLCS